MWWRRHQSVVLLRYYEHPHRLNTQLFNKARNFHNISILLRRRVLLCGDGNLSYAASIAERLQQEDAHLTATVLESQEEHNRGTLQPHGDGNVNPYK
jgi:hypothetical protein